MNRTLQIAVGSLIAALATYAVYRVAFVRADPDDKSED